MSFGTIIILGFIFVIGLALVVFLLIRTTTSSGGDMQERIQVYATVPEYAVERKTNRTNPRLFRMRRQLNSMLSLLGTEELNLQLMRADWNISATEYMLIRIGLMVVGFVLGWMFLGNILSGLALAILANLVPGLFLRRSASRRQIKFEGQLVDVLVLITGICYMVLATLAMGLSAWIKNRYLVLIIPFFYYMLSGTLIEILGINRVFNFNLAQVYALNRIVSTSHVFIYLILLMILGFGLFYSGVIAKNEKDL